MFDIHAVIVKGRSCLDWTYPVKAEWLLAETHSTVLRKVQEHSCKYLFLRFESTLTQVAGPALGESQAGGCAWVEV